MAARWSHAEDETLARLYADGVPLREMAARMGRTEDAITARRRALGVADRRPSWTPFEDRLIVAAARAGVPASAVARQLGLPVDRVRGRRARLAGTRPAPPRYTAAEDDAIRATWSGGGSVEALAAQLGRAPDALRRRAQQLGVHRPPARRRWTADEDRAVRAGYAAGSTCAEIAARLDGRSAGAVCARAGKLGLGNYARRWTAADDRKLRSIVTGGGSIDEAAIAMVRTPEGVRGRLRHLGVVAPRTAGAYPREGLRWTEEDDRLMRRHIGSHPSALSWLLGRSDHAVRARMRRLGLMSARPATSHYPVPGSVLVTPGERAVIARELLDARGRRLHAVASRLGRTPGEVRRLLAGGEDAA